MSQYILSDEALQDLNQVSEYFLQNNLEAGEKFLQAFNIKCRPSRHSTTHLESHPILKPAAGFPAKRLDLR
jgi:plasmid stabilization system protein ParE